MFKVNVPVQVKLILTEQTKQAIIGDLNRGIQQIQNELEQLEFQARKALSDAEKQGPQAVAGVQGRINQERGQRMERREQMTQQLVNIQQTPIGTEISGGQMEAPVDINVGDVWEEVVQSNEIVLKEGVVVEIRRAGGHA
ncbi:MAG TPA: YlqD family protein [Bacilli bacterium]|nr:YlqD family protein [Bacilli bacterium]